MSTMAQMDQILIKDLKPGQKSVNIVFIVLDLLGTPTMTKEKREIRTFKVADQSACINVSVWDEPGALMMPGDIIKLTKGYCSMWRNCLTLYSGKIGELQKIGEFCMAYNDQVNMSEPNAALTSQLVNNQLSNGNNGNNGKHVPVQNSAPTTPPPVLTEKSSSNKGGNGAQQATYSSSSATTPSPTSSGNQKATTKNTTRARATYSRNGVRASERR
ncbi:SOSS complex subunit B homolog [Trichogramma pretiosum]|uniref:SOSS complex subunit B homolog n=1 Tax=Trichogramma pretiosum TaxID=7493 RepID=UPI0006C9C91E|nr:SOSS complex subunit B homolog [Trichogramma pretiosum]